MEDRKAVNTVNAKRKRIYQIILWVLIALTVGTIWSLSLRSATTSNEQSNAVALPVINSTDVKGVRLYDLLVIVRKLAHFAEFGLLGFLWGLYSRLQWYPAMWLYGLGVALIDEGLQYFVPGRAPGFWDVVIDYSGFFCGFALVMVAARWLSWKKSRRIPK